MGSDPIPIEFETQKHEGVTSSFLFMSQRDQPTIPWGLELGNIGPGFDFSIVGRVCPIAVIGKFPQEIESWG